MSEILGQIRHQYQPSAIQHGPTSFDMSTVQTSLHSHATSCEQPASVPSLHRHTLVPMEQSLIDTNADTNAPDLQLASSVIMEPELTTNSLHDDDSGNHSKPTHVTSASAPPDAQMDSKQIDAASVPLPSSPVAKA